MRTLTTAHQPTTLLRFIHLPVPFCRTHSPPLKSNSGRPRSVGTHTLLIHLARPAPSPRQDLGAPVSPTGAAPRVLAQPASARLERHPPCPRSPGVARHCLCRCLIFTNKTAGEMDSPPHPPAESAQPHSIGSSRRHPSCTDSREAWTMNFSLSDCLTHTPSPPNGKFGTRPGPIPRLPRQLGRGRQGRARRAAPAAPLAPPRGQLPPSSGSAPRGGWWGPSPRTPRPRPPRTRSPGGSRRPAAPPPAAPACCPARPRRAGTAARRGRNPPRRPWRASARAGPGTRAAPAPRRGWPGRRRRGGRARPWLRTAAGRGGGAAAGSSRGQRAPSLRAPGGSSWQPRTAVQREPGSRPEPCPRDWACPELRAPARAPPARHPGAPGCGGRWGGEPRARSGLGERPGRRVAREVCAGGGPRDKSASSALTVPVLCRRCTPHIAPTADSESDRRASWGQEANDGMILFWINTLTSSSALLFPGCPARGSTPSS